MAESCFQPLPLGRPIPGSPHSVSCSLPTMADVCGYEEKRPEVMERLAAGYPRFVVHAFARRLGEHFRAQDPVLAGRTLWLAASARAAAGLAGFLGADAAPFTRDGVHGVSHREDADTFARAKLYLQNTGGFLSSREAEDHLVRLGLVPAAFPEATFAGDAGAEVRRHLRPALAGAADRDLFLANCGMGAIHAAFRAVSALQAPRGRTVWLQLGWLYLDTIAILKRFTAAPADYVYVRDVLDLRGLERLLAAHGGRVAGVIAEVPTNPLIQTPDLPALRDLCRRHGATLLVDPSISSVFNVDVLRNSDLVVSSLTKYAASEGDLTAGLCAVNPSMPDADALRRALAAEIEPPYRRDLARLAVQIAEVPAVTRRINEATAQVAAFLAGHPAVKDVFWALHPESRSNYGRLARAPDATGGMITFTLRRIGGLAPFYDRLRLPKGPSFGMKTTLICPFMYLAHYDLVTTPAGLAELSASRLDPDLLRLCVGTEPVSEIIGALAEALG